MWLLVRNSPVACTAELVPLSQLTARCAETSCELLRLWPSADGNTPQAAAAVSGTVKM